MYNEQFITYLVHEHCHPSHNHQYEEVLEQWIFLPAHQHPQDHDRDGFTRLADDLSGIIDPGERLVARHHGQEVGEGAEGVVGALGRVLLRGGEDEAHDEGIEIVDHALEEDKRCDAGEPLLSPIMDIFASCAEQELCH